MKNGILANQNQDIDYDTAATAEDLGFSVNKEEEGVEETTKENSRIEDLTTALSQSKNLQSRAPVMRRHGSCRPWKNKIIGYH